MKKNNSLFDDLSKLASSTIATLINLKNEFSNMFKEQMHDSVKKKNLTSKSDFNSLKQSVSQLHEKVHKINSENNKHNYNGDIKMATTKTPTKKTAPSKTTSVTKSTSAKTASSTKTDSAKKAPTVKKAATTVKSTAKPAVKKATTTKATTAKKPGPKKPGPKKSATKK